MKKNECKPLNKEFPEFFLEQLEQRLETDPLSVGVLLNIKMEGSSDRCWGYSSCMPEGTCEKTSCSWY